MKSPFLLSLILIMLSQCQPISHLTSENRTGIFTGKLEYGNFSDDIIIELTKDSSNFQVYFTSLGLNANKIPLQNIKVNDDSISFELQSDFFKFTFKNKWTQDFTELQGVLHVDTVYIPYTLTKGTSDDIVSPKSEDFIFSSNGLKIHGTVWHSDTMSEKGLVLITSSQNWDRSSSRALAIHFTNLGYTTFHYDKRGTGESEGNWHSATMKELLSDDINAIHTFSTKTGIPLSKMGIMGSSQGGAKIPYILNAEEELAYGIVISCPGSSLMESDLNYWRNSNKDVIGEEIEIATNLVRKFFMFSAGTIARNELEKEMNLQKSKPWYNELGIPNLEEVSINTKILYTPMPYFKLVKRPLLVIQGSEDEIIPLNSLSKIKQALKEAENPNHKMILLDNATHSMHFSGQSDFPYMPKLHSDYLDLIAEWLKTVTD